MAMVRNIGSLMMERYIKDIGRKEKWMVRVNSA